MYSAIVFLPLVGALVAGFGGRLIGDRGAQVVTCGAMLAASVLGVVAFWEVAIGGRTLTVEVMPWIVSGSFEASWALRWDTLTAVMVLVVTVVSTMVVTSGTEVTAGSKPYLGEGAGG